MFTKTMTFDDLEGNPVTETFYFNYNKKEIAELLEYGRILDYPQEPGFVYEPLETVLEKLRTPVEKSGLSEPENARQAYMRFQTLILDAFGRKGADMVTFEKSVEIRNHFKSHVAFVELIFEFVEDSGLGAQFIEKCLPPRLIAEAKKETGKSVADMVKEAERRQSNPDTAIAPGDTSLLNEEDPAVKGLAEATAKQEPAKRPEDLTPADIEAMDDVAFAKLEPRGLSQEAMVAAFRRKTG